MFIVLKGSEKLLSEHSVTLPGGGSVSFEVVDAGDGSYIVGEIWLDARGHKVRDKFEGFCKDKSVGSVSCPNNDPVLNCGSGSISCGS